MLVTYTKSLRRLAQRRLVGSDIIVSRCFSIPKFGGKQQHDELVKVFPQLSQAETHVSAGKYNKAVELLTEVREILSNAMGARSPQSAALALQAAEVLRQGSAAFQLSSTNVVNKIEHLLRSSNVLDSLDISTRLNGLNLIAMAHLSVGQPRQANQWSDEALKYLENQSGSDVSSEEAPLDQFSRTYSLKGLSLMHMQQFDEAETYLQLAARWAQDKTSEIVGLSNLGALCWLRGTHEVLEENRNELTIPLSSKALEGDKLRRIGLFTVNRGYVLLGATKYSSSIDNSSPTAGNDLSVGDAKLVSSATEAMAYWDEAIDVAVQVAKEIQVSMCGPVTQNLTKQSESSMLGPNYSARVVSSPSSESSISDSGDSKESLESRISDVQFAAAYSSVLCNAAMGGSVVDPLSKRPSELLAAALKVIDLSKKSVSTQLPGVDPSQEAVAGRILGLIAVEHLATGNLLTCEGLIRSSLSKMDSILVQSDVRYVYERALIQRSYGQLLQQWDKRENEGNQLVADSLRGLARLPAADNSSLTLTCLAQFPAWPF